LPLSSRLSLFELQDLAEIHIDSVIYNQRVFEPPNPGTIEEMRKKARQNRSRPLVSSYMGSHEYFQLEATEIEPFILRALIASQENNPQSLYQVIDDYRKSRGVNLIEEDVVDLINKPYMGRWACIHYTCYCGNLQLLRALLNLQANCNIVTDDQWTPLQLAAYEGHVDCVSLLASHPSIQINKMTAERGTALHIAVIKNNPDIVEVLLNHNAAPYLEDQFHKSPIELCTNDSVRELLKNSQSKALNFDKIQEHRPLSFSGEVWFSAKWQINDKKVYLVLDTDQGVFKHYNKRNNYINDIPADFQIPIKDIQDVCLSCRSDLQMLIKDIQDTYLGSKIGEKNVFTVETKESSMMYYCEYADMSAEWFKKILESLNFFHLFLYDPANRDARRFHEENKFIRNESANGYEETGNSGEVPVTEDSFQKIEEIGSGTFGKVFKVMKKDTKEIYALKILKKVTLRNRNQLKYAIAECKTLKNIRNPYIIRLEWGFQSPSHIYMVLEYCPYGDFTNILNYYKKINESKAKIYISQVILAIEYLHSLNIVYRDLKPSNLLVDKEGYIKLADFSLAKENVTQDNPAMSFCGTPSYLPPEILNNLGAYKPADIYCIGVNLFEMVTGESPFQAQDLGALYTAIMRSRVKFPSEMSEDAKDFIQSTMNRNPELRPNIKKVKEHKFFRDINWNAIYQRSVLPPISVDELDKIITFDSEMEKDFDGPLI
jgi:tRNA A-37 threonylcarbamoyl transferase component Bud32